ncbi:MAG TPA: GNAT family N-acetyltransferase [Candidatus Eisenbacteria bacterium]|nr:GNAT family N-acetyltransferase [Candidatus Eisenbacteria bacterium]
MSGSPLPTAVATVTSLREFDELAAPWDDLHRASAGAIPFLRHSWLRIWWEHFGGGADLEIVVARRGERLAAALPLHRGHERLGLFPLRTLEGLSNDHSFRFGPLCRDDEPEALEAIWAHLRSIESSWDLVLLREVAEAEGEEERDRLFAMATRDGYPAGIWHSYASPYLRLGTAWETYIGRLPGKFRYSLRSRAKKLDAEGPVTFELLRDGEVTDAILDGCFDVERRGWKGEAGSAIASDPALHSFYAAVARDAGSRGALRVGRMRIGERIAAFDLSFQEGDRYYCLKIGYDPDFARFGVGQLLNARILEWCCGAGVTDYEFLGPLTEAKDAWQPSIRRHVWIYLFGRGHVPRAAHAFKFVLGNAIRRKVTP